MTSEKMGYGVSGGKLAQHKNVDQQAENMEKGERPKFYGNGLAESLDRKVDESSTATKINEIVCL